MKNTPKRTRVVNTLLDKNDVIIRLIADIAFLNRFLFLLLLGVDLRLEWQDEDKGVDWTGDYGEEVWILDAEDIVESEVGGCAEVVEHGVEDERV